MKHKLTKTLLIGLGGTGNLALKYAKKRFYEIYANEEDRKKGPTNFDIPLIEYLAIDTDLNDLKKGVGFNEEYSLNTGDFYHAKVDNPIDTIEANPFIEQQWMPKENMQNLEAITDGAGQVRSLGRLAFVNNFPQLKNLIKNKIEKLNGWENDLLDRWSIMGTTDKVNVVFCFSVAGGTGSGCFLDLAYLTKSIIGRAHIDSQAYIVLPEIFDKEISVPLAKARIWSNTYAALRELDFCMSNKYNQKVKLTRSKELDYSGMPFKLIHLISDTNTIGNEYDKIPHIMELIGNNIVLKSGKLNTGANSSWDNIKKGLTGINPIGKNNTHQPRYLGMGYAELKYNTDVISEFFILQNSTFLLDKILDTDNRISDQKLDGQVKIWQIQEHEADLLIDNILPPSTKRFTATNDGWHKDKSATQLQMEGDNWLNSRLKKLKETADANLQKIRKKKIEDIILYIEKEVLNSGGIKTAIECITKLKSTSFIALYKDEMNNELDRDVNGFGKGVRKLVADEKERRKRNFDDLKATLQEAWSYYFAKNKAMPSIDNIISSYSKQLSWEMELIRRESAIVFYVSLEQELDTLNKRLEKYANKVEDLYISATKKEEKIGTEIKNSSKKPFVENLDNERIASNKGQTLELSNFLSNANLKDILEKDPDAIQQKIVDYIKNHSSIKSILKEDITNILTRNYSKQARLDLFTDLVKRAAPIMKFNESLFKDYLGDKWTKALLWGVPDENNPIYKNIEKLDPTRLSDSMTTYSKSAISISTIDYPAPLFSLPNMQRYYDEYYDENAAFSFDIDKRLKKRITEERFEILKSNDLGEKQLFSWIFGCILNTLDDSKGVFRGGNGRYFIYDTKRGDIMSDYKIGLTKTRRNEAFQVFGENGYHEQMTAAFKQYFDALSRNDQINLLKELQDMNLYFEKYAGVDRNIEDIRKSAQDNPKDKKLYSMLRKEVEFLEQYGDIDSIRDYI